MTWTTYHFLKLCGCFVLVLIAGIALDKFLDAMSGKKGQRHD